MKLYPRLALMMTTHPDWETASNGALATWANEAATRNVDRLSTGAVFDVILQHRNEWRAMSAADREDVRDILLVYAATGIDTRAESAARALLVTVLGPDTKAALAALITVSATRAQSAGISEEIGPEDIAEARAILGRKK